MRLAPADPGGELAKLAARTAVVNVACFAFLDVVLGLPVAAGLSSFFTFALLVMSNFGGPLGTRLLAYVVTATVGVGLLTAGMLAAQHVVTAVAGTFLVVAVITFATVIRGALTAAAPSLILSFVMGVASGPGLPELSERLTGWAVGGAFASAGAVLLWPTRAGRALDDALRAARESAGRAVAQLWPAGTTAATGRDEFPADSERVFAEYDGRLGRPGVISEPEIARAISGLRRLRECLAWAATRPWAGAPLAPRAVDLAELTAAALTQPDRAAAVHLNSEREHHLQRILAGADTAAAEAESSLRLVSAVAVEMAAEPVSATVADTAIAALPSAGSRLEQLRPQLNIRSPWLWHAMRSGLTLAAATAVMRLIEADYGFWVVLGTLTAMRFDIVATWRATVGIAIGTVIGIAVGWPLFRLLADAPAALWLGYAAIIFLVVYAPAWRSVAVGQALFTAYMFAFFTFIGDDPGQIGVARAVDVALSLLVAVVLAALLWPRGLAVSLPARVALTFAQAQEYFAAAVDRLRGSPVPDPALRAVALAELARTAEMADLALAQGGAAAALQGDCGATIAAATECLALGDVASALADAGLTTDDPVIAVWAADWQAFVTWLQAQTPGAAAGSNDRVVAG